MTRTAFNKCIKSQSAVFYWVKQSAMRACRNDWMNVFMDMSFATNAAEAADKNCKVSIKWVSRSKHLASEDSKMFQLPEDFQLDVSEFSLKPPQELTEERELVAY